MIRPVDDCKKRKTQKTEDRKSDQKIDVVYFLKIKDASGTRIKIGTTSNYAKRIRDHKSGGTLGALAEVEELCLVRGATVEESQVHQHFADIKWMGKPELFHPESRLVDYIRWLRDQYYVWVPEDMETTIDTLPIVPIDNWKPREDRRKTPPRQSTLFPVGGELLLPPRDTTPDDFYTNPMIIEAARRVLGCIDLDPASHAIANRNVKATTFYSATDSGLERKWFGNVWLNPPFSQWASWVPKIVSEWRSGRVSQMLILCATRTLTAQYFRPINQNSDCLCIIHGRIPFWGGLAGTPDDGHAVFYFGQNLSSFNTEFACLGTVYQTLRGEL